MDNEAVQEFEARLAEVDSLAPKVQSVQLVLQAWTDSVVFRDKLDSREILAVMVSLLHILNCLASDVVTYCIRETHYIFGT